MATAVSYEPTNPDPFEVGNPDPQEVGNPDPFEVGNSDPLEVGNSDPFEVDQLIILFSKDVTEVEKSRKVKSGSDVVTRRSQRSEKSTQLSSESKRSEKPEESRSQKGKKETVRNEKKNWKEKRIRVWQEITVTGKKLKSETVKGSISQNILEKKIMNGKKYKYATSH